MRSDQLNILLCINVILLCSILSRTMVTKTHEAAALPCNSAPHTGKLNLTLGFNISFSSFLDTENTTAAVEAYGYGNRTTGNIFFPILGNLAFYNISGDAEAPGFALGLLYSTSDNVAFLAICGGVMAKLSTSVSSYKQLMQPSQDTVQSITIEAYSLTGSFVVPVWVANWEKPLSNVFRNISLSVVAAETGPNSSTKQLQLRNDVDGMVVWNVSNVESMEILNNGTLQINSQNHELVQLLGPTAAHPSDTLFSNHKLTPGDELRSNGSDMFDSFSARVTTTGLGVYSTVVEPAVPFLFFPFDTHNGTADPLGQNIYNYSTTNLTSACTDASVYILPSDFLLILDPGTDCRSSTPALLIGNSEHNFTQDYCLYKFITLGLDGRLHITGVFDSSNTAESASGPLCTTVTQPMNSYQVAAPSTDGTDNGRTITRSRAHTLSCTMLSNCMGKIKGMGALDSSNKTSSSESSSSTNISITTFSYSSLVGEAQSSIWGPICDLPTSCGPLGVCKTSSTRPFDEGILCSCPFEFMGETSQDNSNQQLTLLQDGKGCKRYQDLPKCSEVTSNSSSSSDSHIVFLELNQTTTVFTFSGWSNHTSFYNLNGTTDHCKNVCLSNCLCQGFLFIYDEDETSNKTNSVRNIGRCHLIPQDFQGSFLYLDNDFHYSTINQLTRKSISSFRYSTFLKFMTLENNFQSQKNNQKTIIIISIAISSSLVILVIVGLVTMYMSMNHRKSHHKSHNALHPTRERVDAPREFEMELQEILYSLQLTRFKYEDLLQATMDFTNANLLGCGAFGSVYKGQLDDGREVAIKVLHPSMLTKGQTKVFLRELACVGRTNHANIVQLFGFCWEYSHKSLVYEYVDGGSLNQWIFHDTQSHDIDHVLDWGTRYNIAIGIARGLNYLHEECTKQILHLDIKPENILLSGNEKVPKLADFGLSKLMQSNDISRLIVSGPLGGTRGYIDPEICLNNVVSKKSDIYSLGMVLLEVVGGRRNIGQALVQSSDQQSQASPSWATQKCEQGFVVELVDKRLNGSFDEEQARTLIFSALHCINKNPTLRPNIKTILQWLEGTSIVT